MIMIRLLGLLALQVVITEVRADGTDEDNGVQNST